MLGQDVGGRRWVIVGDGAAGLAAARFLRRRDLNASIVMVADDPHPAYYRAALTNYLLGELRDDQLWAVPPGFFGERRIERMAARAVGIEGTAVRLTDGGTVSFDGLLIASGARARPPAFDGAELEGVTTLRTLADAQAILDAVLVRQAKRAVVVGGGPLAVELATALAERSLSVALVVRGQAILSGALDAVASDLVASRLRQLGVDVRFGDEVVQALGDERVGAAHTKLGHELPCDLLGVAIGVLPNSEWTVGAGLAHERGAIVVDDRMQTTLPNIYAAGDVAKPPGPHVQLWEPAQVQGRIAAMNMTGRDERYTPLAHYFATRLGDLDFACAGRTDGSDDTIVSDEAGTGAVAYRKLWFSDGRLVGALMLGHRSEQVRRRGRMLKKIIDRAVDVSSVRDDLLDTHFDLTAWLARAELLVPRPPVAGAPHRATSAIRGTQVIRSHATEPMTARAGHGKLDEQRGEMLSVGFGAPLTRAVRLERPAGVLASTQQRYPIDQATMIIGRDRSCDIVLEHPAMSHRHASVSRHGVQLYVRDLGSRLGTRVNGTQIITPHLLQDGDRLQLPGVELVFQQHGGATSPEQPVAANKQAYLDAVAGPCLGVRFPLSAQQTTLGRDVASTVRLDDISVSRRHALISVHGTSWAVCDLHSSKGTNINGRPLTPGHDEALSAGDELRLGDTVLRFELQ